MLLFFIKVGCWIIFNAIFFQIAKKKTMLFILLRVVSINFVPKRGGALFRVIKLDEGKETLSFLGDPNKKNGRIPQVFLFTARD